MKNYFLGENQELPHFLDQIAQIHVYPPNRKRTFFAAPLNLYFLPQFLRRVTSPTQSRPPPPGSNLKAKSREKWREKAGLVILQAWGQRLRRVDPTEAAGRV